MPVNQLINPNVVERVCGKGPDGAGNVALNAADVGGVSAGQLVASAPADMDICAGQAVMLRLSGHLAPAQANAPASSAVLGLAVAGGAAGFAVAYARVGLLTLADWTAAAGRAALSAGSSYYLDPANPGGMTTVAPVLPGQCVVRLGEALTPTQFSLDIQPGILL